ncbi:integrin alpha [Streptomyces sp. NBC_01016]|uniref:FG-GAP repeat protein n=1 Tax=Streptomyces sp. NBC_01016 TaxID=2903720 RepID=UPI002259833F|nr:FG-GAP repeat protein [Streptomyces sp. NBC_01016]MCX4827984.1 integrin alpha [Streptomyces sp. NBC_01016]
MAKHRRNPAPSPARLRLAMATATAAALTGGIFVATAGTATAATPGVAASDADFNGDGMADVATSAPLAYVGGHSGAGQVSVLYGGGKHTTISQDSTGVPGTAETNDAFGSATAYGDFNSDGFDDLVVGAPGEDVGTDKDGGTAAILWGSANGLSGGKSGKTLTDPRPSKHDAFGARLTAGDYFGAGTDDIIVATPNSSTMDRIAMGGDQSWSTLSAPVQSGSDGVGVHNLHTGDVNGDGLDDLLVNGYEADSDMGWNANYYLPGGSGFRTGADAVKLPAGVITDVGDVDSDGYGDVVIGLEWDTDSGVPGAQLGGAVKIAHGSANGPVASAIQTIDQDTSGVPGGGETGDDFGGELDLGDINGDGHLDLVVGSVGENLGGVADAGAITVLYGAADGSGITGAGAELYSQNTPGVPNSDEKDDNFGSDVHIDDLNDDGRGDVIVGALGENGGNGAVYALNSQADGTLSGSAGTYVSTLGISGSGTPLLGANFAD